MKYLKGLSNTKLPFKKLTPILMVVLFLMTIGYFGYEYYKTQKELSAFQEDETVRAIKEKNDIIKKVGKLAFLPQDEEPTMAEVTKAVKVRSQKFFSQAEDGDRVLIYPKSQRAVLYRPSINKVIELAPISLSEMENTVSRTALNETVLGDETSDTVAVTTPEKVEPEEPAKLAIYNGTLYIEGLATKVGAFLVKEMPGNTISVEILKNAEEVYDETIIIDVTQKHHDVAEQIKDKLSGKLEEPPYDVTFPDVDIVIIAGTDILDKDLQ